MNNVRKGLLTTLAIVMLAAGAISCNQVTGSGSERERIETEQLATPTNLAINGTTLSWSPVSNTVGFNIYVDGKVQGNTTFNSATTFNLALLGLPVGSTARISVRALAQPGTQFRDSEREEGVDFTMPDMSGPTRLDTPLLIQNGSNLSWDPVPNAHEFEIFVNGILRYIITDGNATSFDPADISPPLPVGTHNISIRALADPESNFLNSESSKTVAFVVRDIGGPDYLVAPVLKLDGSNLSWGAIDNAVGFGIYVGEDRVHTINDGNAIGFDLATLGLSVGTHNISIRALAQAECEDHKDSKRSNSQSFIVVNIELTTPLDAPTGLTVNNTTLSWDSVPNANQYRIYVGEDATSHVVSGTTFTLTNLTGLGGDTSAISVRALPQSGSTKFKQSDLSTSVSICSVSRRGLNNLGNCPDFNCSTNSLPVRPGGDTGAFAPFSANDGRANIARIIAFLNERYIGNAVPGEERDWGEWIEARITDAIRAAELEAAILAHPSPLPSGMPWPNILRLRQSSSFDLTGIGLAPGLQPDGRRLMNIGDDIILPGLNNVPQALTSFAGAETIGSAMMVHENHYLRGRPMYRKNNGSEFPCIPLAVLQAAIEFHVRAVQNMHDVEEYFVNGENLHVHDTFRHFAEFTDREYLNLSRFTNNPNGIPFDIPGSANEAHRAFGLRFRSNPTSLQDNRGHAWANPLPLPDRL